MNINNTLLPHIEINLNITCGIIALTAYAIWRGRKWWNTILSSEQSFTYNEVFTKQKLMHTKMQNLLAIRKGRLDDPTLEVDRLLKIGAVTKQDKKSAQKWVKEISTQKYIYLSDEDKKIKEQKVSRTVSICLQGIALQNVLKETHYLFWHAQSVDWMSHTYLLNAIEKRQNPTIRHYKFLRSTHQFKKKMRTVLDYSRNPSTHDHEPQARRDLISTSSYLGDQSFAESALWYLYNNTNQLKNESFAEVDLILSHYPRVLRSEAIAFAKAINQYIHEKKREEEIGNLIAFCVPKNDCEDVQYRSENYGVPLTKIDGLEVNPCKVMEQNDLAFPCQYRIFIPALNPHKHSVYMFSAVPKEVRQNLKFMVNEGLKKFEKINEKRSWFQYGIARVKEMLVLNKK